MNVICDQKDSGRKALSGKEDLPVPRPSVRAALAESGVIREGKRPTDAVLERVIRAQAGLVRGVAKAVGVDPSAVRQWRARSPKIDRIFREVREEVLDLAEMKLLEAIRRGRTAEIIFFLKCHGKARGYVERTEVSVPVQSPPMERRSRRTPLDPEVRRAFDRLMEQIGKK